MLLFYVEYIGKKFRSCQSISGKRIWSQIAEGWFLDLQEFLEVWPSVKGGGNTKRRWLYMYPVFWFDEPKSVEVWKRKKRRKHGADELQFYIRRR